MQNQNIGIIGGGPAGIATAIRLKQYGFNIVLFDADTSEKITVGEHLAAEAMHELKKLKIPESLIHKHSIPCVEVQNAWATSEIHHNESIFNPFGNSYILSRPDFDLELLEYCKELGINIQSNTRISKVIQTEKGWNLTSQEKNFIVDFLIDASGRTSKFRFNGAAKKTQPYNALIGITKQLTHEEQGIKKSHLLIESVENGWWYTVQIASGELISTFMTDPKIVSQSQITQDAFWKRELQKSIHTKKRLASFEMNDRIFTQSAHSHLAPQIQGNHWLKVGDAAQSFDPLSSAGIIKGFIMGIQAADAIYHYKDGNKKALQVYASEVKEQYVEYEKKRDEFYLQETRWTSSPFWYTRVLHIKKIQSFSVTPMSKLLTIETEKEQKIDFLSNQLPDINFYILFDCIKKFPLAKDAIGNYLKETQSPHMNPWLLHALEGLKLIGAVQ